MLQIVLAIAVKTISNYTNHLCHTEVDDVFAKRSWSDPGHGGPDPVGEFRARA